MSRNNRIGLYLLIFTVLLTFTRPSVAQSNLVFWGLDAYGISDIPPGTYASVAASYNFAVAIRTDGTLADWGTDDLGVGVLNAPSGTFKAVAADDWGGWAVGVRSDGTLTAWGDDRYGELNVPTGTFTAVTIWEAEGLALRPDGTVAIWGSGYGGNLTAPSGTFTAISGDVGLRADGTVECFWGPDPPDGIYSSISWGHDGPIALQTDGTPVTWDGTNGGLPAPSGPLSAVSAGFGCDAAIRADGTLAIWDDSSDKAPLPSGTFSSVSAGWGYFLAIQAVPEPSSLLALVCGIAGAGGMFLFRRR
jgi:hypothetical protein